MFRLVLLTAALAGAAAASSLESARDRQDSTELAKQAGALAEAAVQPGTGASAYYKAALAYSYSAEVASELRDKAQAAFAAERGARLAKRAVELAPDISEHHRILGTLCGQLIPANLLAALKYGRCAIDEIEKAIQLDGKSAIAYLSRGVGNYYLPPSFGGGVELALRDFRKAIELRPKLAEAHLWLGIALRKANRNAEARQAFERSLQLNPHRIWARQQLEKTPAQ